MKSKIGKCVVCENDSTWNTPHLGPNGILCNSCAYKSPIMVKGVEQFYSEGKLLQFNGAFTKNHITLSTSNNSIDVWYNDGGIIFPLSKVEKEIAKKNPEKILDFIQKEFLDKHQFRCTSCSKRVDDADQGGRPLFAGRVCKKCWEKHKDHLKEEKANGHVCGMCGQPYSNCCC